MTGRAARPNVISAILLTSSAIVATYLPARRAARTDPIASLRLE